MLTPKQIRDRVNYLGGSDQSVIMGIDPYRDDFILRMEKVNGYQEEVKENKYMIAGHMLEKVAIAYCELVNSINITHTQAQYYNPLFNHMRSRIDGKSENGEFEMLIEAKTQMYQNLRKWESGANGIRDNYYYQGIFNAGNMKMAELYRFKTKSDRLKALLDKKGNNLPKLKLRGLEAKISYYEDLFLAELEKYGDKESKPMKIIFPVLFLNPTDYRKIMTLHNNGYTGEWNELFAVYLGDKQIQATVKEVQKQVKRLEKQDHIITESILEELLFENKKIKLLQKFKKKYYEASMILDHDEYIKLTDANNAWWDKYKIGESVPFPTSKSYQMVNKLSPEMEKDKVMLGGADVEKFMTKKISLSIERRSIKSEYARLIREHELLGPYKEQIVEYDEKIKSIDAVLRFIMGDAEKILTDGYEAQIIPVQRITLDYDKMQLEHPEMVAKYLTKKVDNRRLYVNKLDPQDEVNTEDLEEETK